jgi:hypothetical protein
VQGRRAADPAALLGRGAARLDSQFDNTAARNSKQEQLGPKGKPVASIPRHCTFTICDDLLGEERIAPTIQDQPCALAVRRIARDSKSAASGEF